MYHAIGRERESPGRWVLPKSRFERQLVWLKRRRYNVISLDEFVHARINHRLPPPKSVVLAFDDGYADNVDVALPALERYGFAATVFLVSAAGGAAAWDRAGEAQGRALVTLTDAGRVKGRLAFGGHSRTHRSLRSLDSPELEQEISGCRFELETALGVPVTLFSYPYGEKSPEVEQAVVEAGYLAACGIDPAGTDLRATSMISSGSRSEAPTRCFGLLRHCGSAAGAGGAEALAGSPPLGEPNRSATDPAGHPQRLDHVPEPSH